jgi:hypothetical protein
LSAVLLDRGSIKTALSPTLLPEHVIEAAQHQRGKRNRYIV